MSDGITYCSTFPDDTVFGVILNSFQIRWTSSYIANPEYKPEEMLKAVLHALACVVVLVLVWDDTLWNSASNRGHSNMPTLIRILAGHMRFIPAHRQSDDMTATLSPAKWQVESYSSPMRQAAIST